MLFQQILNGLTNGSLYALMAVGVTMVYKSLGMLNFAHGDIMMVGTFITLTFITKLGLPFYVSVPLGIICAAGLGFLLERVILRKVKFSSFVNLLIATVGVSYVLRNASMVIWGTNPQLFPSMFPSQLIEIGEFRITPQSIGIIIISLAIITGLHFFFTKVKIGKCMQLANSDPEGAAMMGVNVTYMRFLTFGISAALACIDRMPKTATVFDCVINPPLSETITAARAAGLNTVPGMRMLVAQMDVIFKFLFNQTVTGADKQACIEELCNYLGVPSNF